MFKAFLSLKFFFLTRKSIVVNVFIDLLCKIRLLEKFGTIYVGTI